MGKASREKGKRGEREASSFFKPYGYDTRRGVQYHGGPDSPDVVGLPDMHIEVKRVESLQLYKAMAQSKEDAGAVEFPIVMHRKNNQQWVIIQPAEDWMMMYEGAQELYRQSGEKAERSLRGFLEGLLERLRRDRMV